MRNNSTKELLPVIQQSTNLLVSASLLHKRLRVQTKFSMWFQRRTEKYGFEKDVDFFPNLGKTSNKGGRPEIDYLLTIDTAKEMAMLEENETGREIRRYFITKEKELRAISHLPQQPELFRGLKPQNINGRKMYPYQAIRERCGYSTRSSSSGHRHRYPGHFVLNGKTLLVTSEFSLHLYRQRQVMNNRIALREMQPVLPFDFGSPIIKP